MTNRELEELADQMLRADADRELCRQCLAEHPDSVPYGNGSDVLTCSAGHEWTVGDGARRDINGLHPILFEPHLKTRRRREIYAEAGIVDPAFTLDRWGKRPAFGMYSRSHPDGRRVSTRAARRDHGAGFYR